MERLVAGIGWPAAGGTGEAWQALARLGNLGVEVMAVRQVPLHLLSGQLQGETALSAAGIDCPFSLPAAFLDFAAARAPRAAFQSWQEVVEHLVFMSAEDFLALVREFKKEAKRLCDLRALPPAPGPLLRGSPSAAQMTYQCMRMLAGLDPQRFFVSPFQSAPAGGCTVMEVYPRGTLRYLDLPDTGYRAREKKDQERAAGVRQEITAGLTTLRERHGVSFRDCPRLSIPRQWQHLVVESDQALDAVVACYATTLFLEVPRLFADPLSLDNLDVLLEGWLYTPGIVAG